MGLLCENSWMATPDNGLAAQLYTAGQVDAIVGNGIRVTIAETTGYPFQDHVRFTIKTSGAVAFPLYLRVPAWCRDAAVKINGVPVKIEADERWLHQAC